MFEVTLNPGLVLILAALAALAAPRAVRPGLMAGAAGLAMWLLLFSEFGASAAFGQIGLEVVPRNLDALNRIFGIGFLIATIILALYASDRRNRYEDAAILLLAGGVVSALFVGDLLSFVAAVSLAGIAAAWVVMASDAPESGSAGVRLLIWHGLEGLLFLVGVAFQLSAGEANSSLERLDARSIGGGFIFAALMIRVGAPLAHVWLKDAVAHASAPGAAALSLFSSLVGVYALARMFPAEVMLTPIGAAMIVIGALYAALDDDLRRASAYALIAHTGVCVLLIGIGSPLAIAGAAAHAFTTMFAVSLMQLALGGFVVRFGGARLSLLQGAARTMPITCGLLMMGGLAVAGAPGLGLYASLAVALESTAQWEERFAWALILSMSAVLAAGLVVRPALKLFGPPIKRVRFREASFAMLLATVLAAFFCVSIGMTPSWLYLLTPPTALSFDPFVAQRVGAQLELLGVAGFAYVLLYAVRLAPKRAHERLLDVDSLYRGPVAGAGRWMGIVLLRLYGAGRTTLDRLAQHLGRSFDAWSRSCDRPYADGFAAGVQFLTICAVLAIILLTGH